jgi:hypothetical protein
VSDIFARPEPEPDPQIVECWECGRLAGKPCSDNSDVSCDSRRSKALFVRYLGWCKKTGDDPYWDGYNDALDMMISRLKGNNG